MPAGVNYSKIKRVLPDISERDDTGDLERLAEKLDHAEDIEFFMKSEAGQAFRDHFSYEINKTLLNLFDSTDDTNKMIAHVERLRSLIGFYKIVAKAETNAETYRNMVDDLIKTL